MLKTTNSVIQASQIATPIVFQSDVTLLSTDAGAAAGPLLDLYRNSASPAASDTIGEIEFNGQDSAGNKQQYALIHGSILSPTSTTEQGQIHFETATAGASTEKMIIGTTNLVINDIGAVFNVRIEGDTDANLFYTDATNSRVGVGTVGPTEKLDVVGGNIRIDNGNLVIGTAGKGIDFSITSSGTGTMTSELLADYEEGTWTPIQGSGLTVVGTFSSSGRYTKVGRLVYLSGRLSASTSIATTAGTIMMTGLPFTVAELTTIGLIGNDSLNAFGGVGAFTTTAYSTSTITANSVIDFSITYSV